MQEHLKLYEDKMEKSLDVLLDEYGIHPRRPCKPACTGPLTQLIITEPRPRSSRSAT